jgi:hypothetical protein
LGQLGKDHEQTGWAELVEFSATSDFAVFSEPDGQDLYEECKRYEELTRPAIMLGRPPVALKPHESEVGTETEAWVLSLDGKWLRCTVQNGGRFLAIREGNDLIKGGMSGSPIIDINGAAIGLVSTSGGAGFSFNPSLLDCLPPWLLRTLDVIDQ